VTLTHFLIFYQYISSEIENTVILHTNHKEPDLKAETEQLETEFLHEFKW